MVSIVQHLQREKCFGTKIRVAKGVRKTQASANAERDRSAEELVPHAFRKDDRRACQENRNGIYIFIY